MISNETQERLVERLIDRIEQLNETIITTIGKQYLNMRKKIENIGNKY